MTPKIPAPVSQQLRAHHNYIHLPQISACILECEEWSVTSDEQQAYSHCIRPGQERQVKVWVICGVNSLIDRFMQQAKERKVGTNEGIMQSLRRKDMASVLVLKQYHGDWHVY
jgi:hypothetical protein